jgi:hypothetical protein
MKSTLNQIEDIKNHGYDLDFSNVFNHAFENYKKIALYAGLFLLVFFILAFFTGASAFISYYGAEHFNKEFFESLQNNTIPTSALLIYTVSVSFLSAFLSPFTAGFLKMADSADKDEEFNVRTMFTYYKSPYFFRLFIVTLLITMTSGLISVGASFLGITIIDSIITLVISFFTSLTLPLIIFGNLSVADAIKSSAIIVSKQPITIILLFFVATLASLVGFIGCCIGVVFTLPITYSVKYAIYTAILGVDENEDSIDAIGKDLE